jgi:polygalacturonase
VDKQFDVMAFGAKGDGKTIDTPAINKAIDDAADSGGGTVQFPAGSFLSYSIHLKSNIADQLVTTGSAFNRSVRTPLSRKRSVSSARR